MKSILFVGDSHLARFELAYNRIYSKSNLNSVFIACPGPVSNLIGFKSGKLYLERNDGYLKSHPLAGQHNFLEWFEKVNKRFEEISDSSGLDLQSYSAIVLVSFQIFNPEVWAAAALARERGEISSRLWRLHTYQTYMLNHGMKRSRHFVLLDQLQADELKLPIFSLATPARSEASNFPRDLLQAGEREIALGKIAFRNAENEYKKNIFENHSSTLIPYPEMLIAPDGLSTRREYQAIPNDMTHLNSEGSEIWCHHVIENINELEKNTASKVKS